MAEVVVCPDEQQVGQVIANRVLRQIKGLTTPILGLTTGNSPLALYSRLARRAGEEEIGFPCGIGFALDEYVSIDPENPLSYRQTILHTMVGPLRMGPTRVRVPGGSASDLAATALECNRAVATVGGVDVQVLGIGNSSHIGFNEPTPSFAPCTRVKTLTGQARVNNIRFFGEGEWVPTHCTTQRLGTIMEIRHIVMVVTGRRRARTITAMIEGPVTTVYPVPIPQSHPNILAVVDEAITTGLNHANYLRHVIDTLV